MNEFKTDEPNLTITEDAMSNNSNTTVKRIEKEIFEKGLIPVVDEICSRQKYKMNFK